MNIFDLFHRLPSGQTLSNEELLEGITILKKSESVDIVSKLVFFLYSDGKKTMAKEGQERFSKENYTRLKKKNGIDEIGSNISKGTVNIEEFKTFFEKYELRKFE